MNELGAMWKINVCHAQIYIDSMEIHRFASLSFSQVWTIKLHRYVLGVEMRKERYMKVNAVS